MQKVIDDGKEISTPYKRPMTKEGFFKSNEFVYDEYYDCVVCPNNKVLSYSTTNRDGYKEFKSNPKDCENAGIVINALTAKTIKSLLQSIFGLTT